MVKKKKTTATKKDGVKVGDVYAIISRGFGASVAGPFYVTSIRGGRVSLEALLAPNPSAKRSWRIAHFDGRTLIRLVAGEPLSTQTAEPWTQEHADTIERAKLVHRMERMFQQTLSTKFANLTNQDLQHIMGLLVRALPAAQKP